VCVCVCVSERERERARARERASERARERERVHVRARGSFNSLSPPAHTLDIDIHADIRAEIIISQARSNPKQI
jgi:hypothetical protein